MTLLLVSHFHSHIFDEGYVRILSNETRESASSIIHFLQSVVQIEDTSPREKTPAIGSRVASKLGSEGARNVFRVYRGEFVGIAKSRKRRARQVLKARSSQRVAAHTYIRGKCTNRSVSHREYVIPRHARAYQFLPLHEIPSENRGTGRCIRALVNAGVGDGEVKWISK